jgi:hypothetical protein
MHIHQSMVTLEGENANKSAELTCLCTHCTYKTSGPLWHHLELSKWAEIFYTLVLHHREQITEVRLRKIIEIFFSI